MPRVLLRAPSGAQDPGQGPGMDGCPGRLPRAMAAQRTSGSATAVATPRFQLSCRVAGERHGEGEGSGEGRAVRGSRYRVRVQRGASPRALLSAGSAPTGLLPGCWPPPSLTAGTKAHPRRAGRSRVPLGCKLAAGRLPAATSGAPRARTKSFPNVPRLCTPALHARDQAAPSARLSVRRPSEASSR